MNQGVQYMPMRATQNAVVAQSDQPGAGHQVEYELLRLCARSTVDAPAEGRIAALLRGEVDWNYLIVTAHQHRVLPLVYRTLGRLAPRDVPEPAMRRLSNAFQANARRNLFLTGELLQVLDLLGAEGIPSIPYKGPVVASLVYGDLSLRQFADLDIIVPMKDVVKARALLLSRGYRPEKPMTEEELLSRLATEKDITLLRDEAGINLEIHWAITGESDPIRIAPQSLWENLVSCSIGGRPVQTFAPDDLLLILCIHGAKHRWEKLGWLCDVAEIVRTPGRVEWNRALERATKVGAGRILLLGLGLATQLLGAMPPAKILQAIEGDPVLKQLSEQVKGWLFSEDPVRLNLGERERYFMRLRENSADRFRVAITQAKLYLAPTSRDKETLPLPACLGWSHYLLRPVRLAGQYGLTPFKHFFKGIFQS